jgi:type IV secretion system protein VirB9
MMGEAMVEMMRRVLSLAPVAVGAWLSCATVCHAEVYPLRGRGDARIRTAAYNVDQVYRLDGFVGFQIDLEFAPGESFVGLASGDLKALSYAAERNHLFLKPRVASAGTNITVLTTQRRYEFYYTATAARPAERDPDLVYVVKFVYPGSTESRARRDREQIEERLDRAPIERPQNRDYWYCGAAELRPVGASDDGVETRLQFSAQAQLPAIFVRNDDGSESLVNFNVDAGVVVIHRVARRFVLRRGGLTGCVVNKGYTGSGERLASGTIAPDVERVRKGAAP